jgi:hypothetical protein
MPLSAGPNSGPTKSSPYWAGGVGEVCRTCGSRLNRDLALQVLPSEVAGDSLPPPEFRNGSAIRDCAQPPEHCRDLRCRNRGNGIACIVGELVVGEPLRGVKLPLLKTLVSVGVGR